MKQLTLSSLAALAALGALVPAASQAAEGLSYGYAEVDYVNLDVDDFDNGDGYKLDFSVPLGERFFLYGNYSETEADFSYRSNLDGVLLPGNTDVIKFGVGLGFIMPMNTSTDFVVSGGYADIDFDDFHLGSSSDITSHNLRNDPSDGYTVDAYFRSQLSPSVEGSLGGRYTDIEGYDGFSLVANVMYELNQNWGINLSADAGSDLVSWAAGVRYSF
ncbi:MAG TPA: hypothetical protein VNR18_14710 [Hyphomicrobiales bacterium]|nr:hypothetical protein [Hyphomicrobiales bacterium]